MATEKNTPENEIVCANCGRQIPSTSAFCGHCGVAVANSARPSGSSLNQQENSTGAGGWSSSSRGRSVLIAVLAATVAVVVLVVVAGVVLRSDLAQAPGGTTFPAKSTTDHPVSSAQQDRPSVMVFETGADLGAHGNSTGVAPEVVGRYEFSRGHYELGSPMIDFMPVRYPSAVELRNDGTVAFTFSRGDAQTAHYVLSSGRTGDTVIVYTDTNIGMSWSREDRILGHEGVLRLWLPGSQSGSVVLTPSAYGGEYTPDGSETASSSAEYRRVSLAMPRTGATKGTFKSSSNVVVPARGSAERTAILDGIRTFRADSYLQFVVHALVTQRDVALANVEATDDTNPGNFGQRYFFLVRDSSGSWIVKDQMDVTDIDMAGAMKRWPGTTPDLLKAFEAGKGS